MMGVPHRTGHITSAVVVESLKQLLTTYVTFQLVIVVPLLSQHSFVRFEIEVQLCDV